VAEISAYLSSIMSVETSTPTPVGGGSGGNATGTGAPNQHTGAAARKGESNAWVEMVAFGVVGLVVL
jgi:hypothetical protein